MRFSLRCFECGATWIEDPARLVCPYCTRQQEAGGVTRGVLEVMLEEIPERWPDVAPELSSDDLSEFQRICLPDSPDFILNIPDYYALFTYTMFWGKTAD